MNVTLCGNHNESIFQRIVWLVLKLWPSVFTQGGRTHRQLGKMRTGRGDAVHVGGYSLINTSLAKCISRDVTVHFGPDTRLGLTRLTVTDRPSRGGGRDAVVT